MDQQEIWKRHASNISVSDIIRGYHNPSISQRELASFINNICEENKYTRVIEIGCESGITNMLLNNDLEKYFLDLNDDMIEKIKQACGQGGINRDLIQQAGNR